MILISQLHSSATNSSMSVQHPWCISLDDERLWHEETSSEMMARQRFVLASALTSSCCCSSMAATDLTQPTDTDASLGSNLTLKSLLGTIRKSAECFPCSRHVGHMTTSLSCITRFSSYLFMRPFCSSYFYVLVLISISAFDNHSTEFMYEMVSASTQIVKVTRIERGRGPEFESQSEQKRTKCLLSIGAIALPS